MPKVTIDDKECTGCGLCYNDECPDVFKEGADGISELKSGGHSGDIPADKKACAQKAADACPVSAITVA
jgi:ferredoxin